MNNISQIDKNSNTFIKSITSFVKHNKMIDALKKSNCYKKKGVSVYEIFCYLLQLVYTGKSMYMNYKTENSEPKFGKDAVYRFLNSTNINWQKFLLQLSGTIIKESLVSLTSKDRKNVIVVDDSFWVFLPYPPKRYISIFKVMS